MPEFDQSLYWKLVPYFRVSLERVHVIVVASGPSFKFNLNFEVVLDDIFIGTRR